MIWIYETFALHSMIVKAPVQQTLSHSLPINRNRKANVVCHSIQCVKYEQLHEMMILLIFCEAIHIKKGSIKVPLKPYFNFWLALWNNTF